MCDDRARGAVAQAANTRHPAHGGWQADLSAPAPRTADGTPDLSGLWRPAAILIGDIAANLPPNSVPYQPWAEKLYKERRANDGRDDPTANCIVGGVPRSDLVPYPFKILQVPGMVVILYEAVHSHRQIFADGRPFPADMNPTWFGYSVGKWGRDAFVVETKGFNDKGWLDNFGKPATDKLRVVERSCARISVTWTSTSRSTIPARTPGRGT